LTDLAVTPCITIEGASKIYGSAGGPIRALDSVDLVVADGEFVALLGPSGCGKSTLLRLIAGLEPPSGGAVFVRGAPVCEPPAGIGMVFQRDVLLDWRTILDNVLLAAEFEGRSRRELADRARALLDRFGLGRFVDRHPWELSGGMRQRAAICRALLCEPSILLMDEPFGALDALTRDDLNLELARIHQEGRRTIVFVTHSIGEAVHLADRVAVMSPSPGRVVEEIVVDLPRPRPLAVRETPAFAAYVAHIRELFTRLGIVRGQV
jgi:NitT/TauT family transport system ATP-binding protein